MSEQEIQPVTANEADTQPAEAVDVAADQADETAADSGEGADTPEQDAPAGYTEA